MSSFEAWKLLKSYLIGYFVFFPAMRNQGRIGWKSRECISKTIKRLQNTSPKPRKMISKFIPFFFISFYSLIHYIVHLFFNFPIRILHVISFRQFSILSTISYLRELQRWYGQYLESIGRLDLALDAYTTSNNTHARVRIHCFCDEFDKASEICDETGDKAASYHLARQFESTGVTKRAIHYYSRAQTYSNAIRLAKVYHIYIFHITVFDKTGMYLNR